MLIRTYNRPDIFVVSVPGAAPIQLLRQGAPLNIPIHNDTDPLHGVKNNWYGSMTHFMNWGKGTAEVNMKLQCPQVVYWAACHAERASGYGEPEHPPFKCPLPETPALGAWGTPSLLALEVRGLLQGSSHGTGPTLCPQHLLILLGRLVIGARDDFSRPSERGQGRCGASVSRAFKTQLAAVNR